MPVFSIASTWLKSRSGCLPRYSSSTSGVKPRPASSTSSRDAPPPPPGELDSATLPSTTLVRLIQPVLAPVTRYQSPLISAIVS
jgi:hypothetical protein